MKKLYLVACLVWAAWLLLASTGLSCGAGTGEPTIILYGSSILEDVIKDEIFPAFQKSWKATTGEDVRAVTSFAGSGTITNQIIFGAPAHVALVATEMDAMNIKNAGYVTTDWRTFKDQGTFAHSVTSIVTRESEPREIHSFEDLAKNGVNVVYPDPTTSGGAQWGILALYGSVLKTTEVVDGVQDTVRARDLLRGVSLNTGSLPESARRALTQFGLGFGDALITYENEALLDISKDRKYRVVVPKSTILIEPKVVIVDMNVSELVRPVVEAFVDFLWSKEAQEALARHNFRVSDEEIMRQYSDKYQEVVLPFSVEYLGGWEVATKTIIDEVWREVQRETN